MGAGDAGLWSFCVQRTGSILVSTADVFTYCVLSLPQSLFTHKEPREDWSVPAGTLAHSWGRGQARPKFSFVTPSSVVFVLVVPGGDDTATAVKGSEETAAQEEEEDEEEDEEEEESVPGCTLFIKNLNFATTEDTLNEVSRKQRVGTGFYLAQAAQVGWEWAGGQTGLLAGANPLLPAGAKRKGSAGLQRARGKLFSTLLCQG